MPYVRTLLRAFVPLCGFSGSSTNCSSSNSCRGAYFRWSRPFSEQLLERTIRTEYAAHVMMPPAERSTNVADHGDGASSRACDATNGRVSLRATRSTLGERPRAIADASRRQWLRPVLVAVAASFSRRTCCEALGTPLGVTLPSHLVLRLTLCARPSARQPASSTLGGRPSVTCANASLWLPLTRYLGSVTVSPAT